MRVQATSQQQQREGRECLRVRMHGGELQTMLRAAFICTAARLRCPCLHGVCTHCLIEQLNWLWGDLSQGCLLQVLRARTSAGRYRHDVSWAGHSACTPYCSAGTGRALKRALLAAVQPSVLQRRGGEAGCLEDGQLRLGFSCASSPAM